MKRILITGATGNIGSAVIKHLSLFSDELEIIAAVRNITNAEKEFPNLGLRIFDFEDQSTFKSAFQQIDVLFLLRPPHISQVDEVFLPLLHSAQKHGIEKIVFLSVQGAEASKVIPHNKIEGLIKSLGFNYIFVRPSYFMQNLTTSLLPEIQQSNTICLPSGDAKFNWIDVENIGEATAILIKEFQQYANKPYEITGTENLSFQEVTEIMTEATGRDFIFKSINPISFYFKKLNQGLKSGFALVMTILHFLPRFQKEPVISDNYEKLIGKKPTTVREFIKREKEKISPPK